MHILYNKKLFHNVQKFGSNKNDELVRQDFKT